MPLRWCFFSGAVHRIPVYHTSLSDLFFFFRELSFFFYFLSTYQFCLAFVSRLVSSRLTFAMFRGVPVGYVPHRVKIYHSFTSLASRNA